MYVQCRLLFLMPSSLVLWLPGTSTATIIFIYDATICIMYNILYNDRRYYFLRTIIPAQRAQQHIVWWFKDPQGKGISGEAHHRDYMQTMFCIFSPFAFGSRHSSSGAFHMVTLIADNFLSWFVKWPCPFYGSFHSWNTLKSCFYIGILFLNLLIAHVL